MPILKVRISSRPSMDKGSLKIFNNVSAITEASLSEFISRINIINSSPPKRPTVSSLRIDWFNLFAAAMSSLSPIS